MAQPIPTSALRHMVRFERLAFTPDPSGGSVETWTPYVTRRVAIKQQRGSEPVQAERLQGRQPALLIVRKDSMTKGIDVSMRAVWLKDGEVEAIYALKTVADMEDDNAFLTMQAIEGAPDS